MAYCSNTLHGLRLNVSLSMFRKLYDVRVCRVAAQTGIFDGTLIYGIALGIWSPRPGFQIDELQRRPILVTFDFIGATNTRSVAVHVRALLAHAHRTALAQRSHLFRTGQANGAISTSIELATTTQQALLVAVVAVLPRGTHSRTLFGGCP